MDLLPEKKTIASDKQEFQKLDSLDFSTKLVQVHTGTEQKCPTPREARQTGQKNENSPGNGRLVNTSESKPVNSATTSFNKWLSQTTLLDHLVEEDPGSSEKDFEYLKKDSFNMEFGSRNEDDFYSGYQVFFEKSSDGTWVNKSVLSYLFNSLDDPEDVKLSDEITLELLDFRKKFLYLLENENKLKLKRVLLTVAFNHYGCVKVWKHMTLDEYTKMLKVHKVFQSDKMAKFVFDSMDRRNRSVLILNEFISGMLSCSPEADHNVNSSMGKLRLQHLFRAYDTSRLGYLHEENLQRMFRDMDELSGVSKYTSRSDQVLETLRKLFNCNLSYDSFFYCVEKKVLENTDLLFRSSEDLANSLRDFLTNSLNKLATNQPKSPDSFSQSILDTELSESKQSSEYNFHRDFTFDKSPPASEPKEYQTQSKSNANNTRNSLWSHTPRVYSEFNQNSSPINNPLYNYNYGNNWSKQSCWGSSHKTESALDRASKLYYKSDDYKELVEETEQSRNLKETPTKKLETQDSDWFVDKEKSTGNPESKVEDKRQWEDDVFAESLETKGTKAQSPQSKIEEIIREYEASPEKRTASPSHKLESLKASQLFEDTPEQPKTPEKYNDLRGSEGNDGQKDLPELDKEFKSFDNYEEQENLQKKIEELFRDKTVTRQEKGVEDLKKNDGNDPHSEKERGSLDTKPADLPKDVMTQPFPSQRTSHRQPRVVDPEGSSQTLTEKLASMYKSKFLVFKGLLLEDKVPKKVLANFLKYSLSDSKNQGPLQLCTFSEMLQLCGSVCSLLAKEDSVLHLKGDFQVYGSLNGDLECLLDLFNAYGWPMVKRKFMEGLAAGANPNFKSTTWADFNRTFVFMGGFVSDSKPVSLEFVLLMFSLKVLFPYHVYFVRSNKDDMNSSNNAGFYNEIYRKFEKNHGSYKIFNDETFILQCAKELFHRVNDVFEFFSVAAVLNNEVLCLDKLTKSFNYSLLTSLAKPLSLSSCDQEQVYDLLFNPSPGLLYSSEEVSGQYSTEEAHQVPSLQGTGSQGDLYLRESPNFKMVICSSDQVQSGFKYVLKKVLLLSSNFAKKKIEKVATVVTVSKNKVTHKSLRLQRT